MSELNDANKEILRLREDHNGTNGNATYDEEENHSSVWYFLWDTV